MKIRISIFWFIAIVAVLIAGLLWFEKRQAGEVPETGPGFVVFSYCHFTFCADESIKLLIGIRSRSAKVIEPSSV